MKLIEIVKNYVELKIKPSQRRPTTKEKYDYFCKLVERYFDCDIAEITASKYQRTMNEIGQTRGRDVLVRLNATIRKSIQLAKADKLPVEDFTVLYEMITQRTPQERAAKYIHKVEDYQRVVAAVIEEMNYKRSIMPYIALFCLKTGMRYSEAVGLTLDCIDLDNQTVKTYRRYSTTTREFVKAKNANSIRLVPMTTDIIQMLKVMQAEQAQYNTKFNRLNPNNFLFQHYRLLEGVPSNEAFNKYLSRLCLKIDLSPVLTSKSLRHTFISMCLYYGLKRGQVARIVGHSDINMIISVYGGELDNSVVKAFEKIKNVL